MVNSEEVVGTSDNEEIHLEQALLKSSQSCPSDSQASVVAIDETRPLDDAYGIEDPYSTSLNAMPGAIDADVPMDQSVHIENTHDMSLSDSPLSEEDPTSGEGSAASLRHDSECVQSEESYPAQTNTVLDAKVPPISVSSGDEESGRQQLSANDIVASPEFGTARNSPAISIASDTSLKGERSDNRTNAPKELASLQNENVESRVMASETLLLPQDEPRRSSRHRTAIQLHPYSMERTVYKHKLNKTGWEDVYAVPDPVEAALLKARHTGDANRVRAALTTSHTNEYQDEEMFVEEYLPVHQHRESQSPPSRTNRILVQRSPKCRRTSPSRELQAEATSTGKRRMLQRPGVPDVERLPRKSAVIHSSDSEPEFDVSKLRPSSAANIPSSDIQDPISNVPRRNVTSSSRSDSDDSASNSNVSSVEGGSNMTDVSGRYKLGHLRKRILGHTMPGVMIRRAEADLALLAKEREATAAARKQQRRRQQMEQISQQERAGVASVNIVRGLGGEVVGDEESQNSDGDEPLLQTNTSITQHKIKSIRLDSIDKLLTGYRRRRQRRERSHSRRLEQSRQAQTSTFQRTKHSTSTHDRNQTNSRKQARKSDQSDDSAEYIGSGRGTPKLTGVRRRRPKVNIMSLDIQDVVFPTKSRTGASSNGSLPSQPRKIPRKRLLGRHPRQPPGRIETGPQTTTPSLPRPPGQSTLKRTREDPVPQTSSHGNTQSSVNRPVEHPHLESWSAIGPNTVCFDIRPLQVGSRFAASSMLSSGRLWEVVHISLSDAVPILVDDLATFWDDVFQALTCPSEQSDSRLRVDLRLMCQYISSTQFQQMEPCERQRFHLSALQGLDHLLDRIENQEHHTIPLLFDWFVVEFSHRLDIASAGLPGEDQDIAFGAAVFKLISNLLQCDLKAMIGQLLDPVQTELNELPLQLWVAIIHLCESREKGSFWKHLEQPILDCLAQEDINAIRRCEAKCYYAFAFSLLSQISLHGIVSKLPILPGNWHWLVDGLSGIDFSTLSQAHHLSHAALDRCDRYLYTMIARCFILATTWNWAVDIGPSSIVTRLFDLLNQRKLCNLRCDGPGNFPTYICQYDLDLVSILDRHDSAMDIVLKLIHRACRSISWGDRTLSRWLSRVSPVRRLQFLPTKPPTSVEISMLYNHYAFEMQMLLLYPQASSQWIRQARNFTTFSQADIRSREVTIRAVMYLAILCGHHAIPLPPVIEWFKDIADGVIQERTQASQKFKQFEVHNGTTLIGRRSAAVSTDSPHDLKSLALSQRQLDTSLQLILRSLQHVIYTSSLDPTRAADHDYPHPTLISQDWITKTLHLTHARDYDVSLEALGCIYAFLEVRKLALPQKQIDSNEVSNQDSQDQFDELDYDDPILNAMLGGHVSVVEPQHQSDDLDRQLAMIIKKDLEPALQSVVNNFFVSPWILASRSYPERQRYLSTSIFCWVGCAAVLVSHGLKNWDSYLTPYGANSWRRIGDRESRRLIGLRFLQCVITSDPQAFNLFRDHFLEVWIECLVTIKPSPLQLDFMYEIVSRTSDSQTGCHPALQNLPTELVQMKHDRTSCITYLALQSSRTSVFEVVVRNSAEIIRSNSSNQIIQKAKPFIFGYYSNALVYMQQGLKALQGTAELEQYQRFCVKLDGLMKARLSEYLNQQTMPEYRAFEDLLPHNNITNIDAG